MAEWFEEWFGEEYLHLYPHRNEADADRMVELLRRTIPWRAGLRVLDVGSGAGRHARAFARAEARVIGLDLSMSLLRRAQEVVACPLVRADMRWLPIREASVDLTVNLFTSFGYFSSDRQHQQALTGMIGTVAPQGWFAIDFLNAEAVRGSLVPEDTIAVGSAVARVTRRISPEGDYVIKTIETPDGRSFMERVRLFGADQLGAMVEQGGARVKDHFGDYQGNPPSSSAPRCILFAQKT